MCPGDLGHLLKPYVFLDLFDDNSTQLGTFPLHPHSGIATLTYLFDGDLRYEDSTGKMGVLPSGGVEWMVAGGGVWHTGSPTACGRVKGFQLWVALPPELENAPAQSTYLTPQQVPHAGSAQVLLGSLAGVTSPIPAPSSMTCLAVRLKAGQVWCYEPPKEHAVAWLAVSNGTLMAPGKICAGEMVIFEESNAPLKLQAKGDAVFVLGSAAKHPHELVMGYYSVHTNDESLRRGEEGIRQIARRLRENGQLGQ